MICPICGNQNIILKYQSNLEEVGKRYSITDSRFGVHGDINQCLDCKLAWVGNMKIVEQAVLSYKAENFDETYEKERDNRKKTAEVLVKKIKKVKPQGKLLDVGCYSGIFLQAAEGVGYEVFGIDASGRALALAAQKVKGNLRIGLVENILLEFPDKYFDIITLFDVLEHLRDPRKILSLINQKLKDDGLLVFSTPDFSSPISKLQGKNWHALLPQHLFYFSFKNLKMLLEGNGFEVFKKGNNSRYFSLGYLVRQLTGVNKSLSKIFGLVVKFLKVENFVMPINMFDQMLIMARKK